MSQITLKDLLNSIKSRMGAIPKGYVITSTDFAFCFPNSFPIIANEQIYEKYIKLWDGQKRERPNEMASDNLCDTPEWWKEVMQ